MITKQRVGLTVLGTIVVCCLAFIGYAYGTISNGTADLELGQLIN